MLSPKYYLSILRTVHLDKLNEFVDEIHKRSGKSKMAIRLDMLHCLRKFGAGFHDYIIFHFYELSDAKRATYMTRLKNRKFLRDMNDSRYAHVFNNKNEFNHVFKDFIGRDFLDMENLTKEESDRFYNAHDSYFAKMLDLECGEGAELLYKKDFPTADDFYKYITEKGFGVVEEVMVNHPDIADIYPHSFNTMRIITLVDDQGESHIVYVAQKFGNRGRFIDVYGMHAPINLDTGKVEFPFHDGATTTDITYTEHPYTGKSLMEYKVPFFEETKRLLLAAAKVIPEVRYVGWDVGVTPKGPVIIEGNDYGAYEYTQLPGQSHDGLGLLSILQKILPNYKF